MIFIGNSITRLYESFVSLGIPFADTIFLFLLSALLLNVAMLYAYLTGWAEMKLIARVHSRLGPTYTGPAGILQPLADMLKFLKKEVIFPKGSDELLFKIAPFMLAIPPFMALIFIPVGSLVLVRSEYSLLIVLALLSFGPIGILIASWASNSKYSTLGGLRAAGMTMSYEVLLAVSAASVVLTTKSLDIVEIVQYQQNMGVWFAVAQPIAFVLFLIGTIAAVERNPFDLVEAESELVSGWRTEYGGTYFLITLLAEYINLLVTLFLFTSLFLGGWLGPLGDLGFIIKILVLTLLMIYIRATALRLRLDQIFDKVWDRMIPLGLINFIATVGILEMLGGW